MNLKLVWKAVSKGVVDNLPTILTIAAELGLIGSVVSAAIDSPKAIAKIQEAKMEKAEKIERESELDESLDIYRNEDGVLSLSKIKLTPWEYVTVLTPIYWKTGVCVLLTGTCIFFSNHINKHRLALLLAALKLKDKEFKEYEEKVKELFGEKKAKEVKKNKKGKNLSRKRFGKSIANRAPAMLLSILDRKLHYFGKELIKINTRKAKASQYNHVEDDYKKKKLSERWNIINGQKVQRDMYSAFLIMNVNEDLSSFDLEKCNNRYENFLYLHNKEVERLQGRKNLSCVGI